MFTESLVFLNNRYPFYIVADGAVLIGGVYVHLSPNLYNKNKSFLKNISKTGEVVVDSNILSDFRTHTIGKVHGFKTSQLTSLNVRFEDFSFPDFKVEVKVRDQTSDPLKKFFELSSTIDKSENEIIVSDNMKTTSKGQSDHLKKLSKKEKVDLKPSTHAFENFFLYNLEDMIKETFVTEMNKEFSYYGLITFSGENKNNNKLNLI